MSKLSTTLLKKVFVYGTLKRGEPNHYWLTCSDNGFARFVDKGTTVERFPLVIGTRYNIPFLLDKRNTGNNIEGEVYEVDEQMMTNLDKLEDYPSYYDREIQTIALNNNERVDCWLYLIRNFPEKLLQKEYIKSYHNSSEKPYTESGEDTIAATVNAEGSNICILSSYMTHDKDEPPPGELVKIATIAAKTKGIYCIIARGCKCITLDLRQLRHKPKSYLDSAKDDMYEDDEAPPKP